MRTSPLKESFAQAGATFTQRYGVEIVEKVADHQAEYDLVRNSVGLSDFSFMQKYRIPEEYAIDFLDTVLAGNVARTRFGRMLHTFLANEHGKIIADCYVANNDEEFILLCESLVSDKELNDILQKAGAADAHLQDITATHALISLDGYQAWKVAKELFGADILGLPYLSIEMYSFEDTQIRFMRTGKTSEFGYCLMVPNEQATGLLDKCRELSSACEGNLIGNLIHNDLRLEGRFFNIFAEGKEVGDPLELGLQWMIDFDKETFIGSQHILDQREKGFANKIIGISTPEETRKLAVGTAILDEGRKAGNIVAASYSYLLNKTIALALLPVDIAYSGLDFVVATQPEQPVRTISMPPIFPKSLSVKLDEME
ncbi:MAG: hypothetical protein GF398_05280 [Chitinivibrionales bacterium]|nr:hypothetical protein [Chitinivibrionales bacterium]